MHFLLNNQNTHSRTRTPSHTHTSLAGSVAKVVKEMFFFSEKTGANEAIKFRHKKICFSSSFLEFTKAIKA